MSAEGTPKKTRWASPWVCALTLLGSVTGTSWSVFSIGKAVFDRSHAASDAAHEYLASHVGTPSPGAAFPSAIPVPEFRQYIGVYKSYLHENSLIDAVTSMGFWESPLPGAVILALSVVAGIFLLDGEYRTTRILGTLYSIVGIGFLGLTLVTSSNPWSQDRTTSSYQEEVMSVYPEGEAFRTWAHQRYGIEVPVGEHSSIPPEDVPIEMEDGSFVEVQGVFTDGSYAYLIVSSEAPTASELPVIHQP